MCWYKSEAVGFCTLKRKGSLVPGTLASKYAMDIVDSVFIRRSHRRLGLTTKLLSTLCQDNYDNLGFSSPISNGMKILLMSYLKSHPEKRDKFWLCLDDGDTGSKKNLWLMKNMI